MKLSPMTLAPTAMNSGADVSQNLDLAADLLGKAASDGCTLAVLPENFALMPVQGRDKARHAEHPGEGPIQAFLADTAAELGLWIISGSMPLVSPESERVYGACLAVDDGGRTRAIYRKIHQILWEDQPYTWLYVRNSFFGFSKELRGYNFSPRGPFHYGPGQASIYAPHDAP